MRFRRGWFLGDGTGAGKGRQVAGILLDNWLKGRRRAVWISKSDKLIEDAQRDWSALGMERLLVTPLSRFRQGTPIRLRAGRPIHHLRHAAHPTSAARSFRASDRSSNGWAPTSTESSSSTRATRCRTRPAARANAATRPPRSRAARGFASSMPCRTPASSMSRRPAPPRFTISPTPSGSGCGAARTFRSPPAREFVEAIEDGGVAAMEVLARDLKALGLYAARSLSYEGVEYELIEHQLTAEQIRIYDAYAGAFAIIHNNLDAAMRAANITGETGTLNAQAKSAARSAFEAPKQRFFNHLITAMKTPSLIRSIERDLRRRPCRRHPDRLDRRGADGTPACRDPDRGMGRRPGRHHAARICAGLSRAFLPGPALRAVHRQRGQPVVAAGLSATASR